MEGGRVPTQIKLYVSVGEMDESIMELVLYFFILSFFFQSWFCGISFHDLVFPAQRILWRLESVVKIKNWNFTGLSRLYLFIYLFLLLKFPLMSRTLTFSRKELVLFRVWCIMGSLAGGGGEWHMTHFFCTSVNKTKKQSAISFSIEQVGVSWLLSVVEIQ